MLDESLLAEVQKRFPNHTYSGTSEISELFDIYVPDFEMKNKNSFAVILNNPIYLFDGLPFAKILLPKIFLTLEHGQQITMLCTAIEQAWALLATKND